MAYNNLFPTNYPQYYPQYPQNYVANNSSNTQNGGIIWVQGEAGAKSYLIAPNTTVQLWDSENQVIYLKSADASGMPSIRTLDYTIRDTNSLKNSPLDNVKQDNMNYATKDEIEALKREIQALQNKVEGSVNKNESTLQSNKQ